MSFFNWRKSNTGWKIDQEKNQISKDDGFSKMVTRVFPELKKFESTFSMQGVDSFKRIYEYKISTFPNPTEIHFRLTDLIEPPPDHYMVKDGVILENEIARDNFESLKKEISWQKMEMSGDVGYAQLFFILSKNSEIVSRAEYRDFLFKNQTRIISGIIKTQEAIKDDSIGLFEIDTYSSGGKLIQYRDMKGLSVKERMAKIHSEDFTNFKKNLFSKTGITEKEFGDCNEILKHIGELMEVEK